MSPKWHSCKYIYLFCIIEILVILCSLKLVISVGDESLNSPNSFSLQARSFRTTSKVIGLYGIGSKYFNEVAVEEEYSNAQSKAKIFVDHKFIGRFVDDSYMFYYTHSKELVKTKTFKSKSVTICEKSDVDSLNNMIYGYKYTLMNIDWNKIAPSHIIGPSKLIFFINHHRNKLHIAEIDPAKFKSIRNVKAITYRGVVSEEDGGPSWDVEVFYDVATLSEQVKKNDHSTISLDTSDQIPLRIIVLDTASGDQIQVEYYTTQLIDGDNNNFDQSRMFGFDTFTLPVASDCFNVLENKINLPIANSEMSFVARSVDTFTNEEDSFEYFVSYSSHSGGNLRRDEIQFDESGQLNQVVSSSTIYDVKSAYKYNIVHNYDAQSTSMTTIDNGNNGLPILEIKEQSQTPKSNEHQCAAVKMPLEEAKLYSDLGLILGFGKVVEMGQAIVRGIDALVFERDTDEPPHWLFPPLSAQMGSGGQQQQQQNAIYTILYYFAKRETSKKSEGATMSDNLGPLLQMDIVQRTKPANGATLSKIIHVRQVDVYEFAWKLQDLPNGDRIDNLFSVYEKCQFQLDQRTAATIGYERKFAKMKLLLKASSDSVVDTRNPGLDFVYQLLMKQSTSRNNALIRTISDTFNIPWPQMADLESTIISSNNGNLLIALAVKLSELPEVSFKTKFVAKVKEDIVNDRSRHMVNDVQIDDFVGAHSLEDCMWRAMHLFTVIRVVYCPGLKCLLVSSNSAEQQAGNNNAKVGRDSADNYGQQFVSNTGTCSLFSVEKQDFITASNLLANGNMYSVDMLQFGMARFHNQFVDLQLPVRATDNQDPFISNNVQKFSIERIQLDEDVPSGSIRKQPPNNQQSKAEYVDRRELTGLGFVWPSPQLKHVHPAQLMARTEEKPADYNSEQHSVERSMDLTQCHRACLMDYDCRSFSLCLNDGQYECTISGQSFKNQHLLQEIDYKQKQLLNRLALDTQYNIKENGKVDNRLISIDLESSSSSLPDDFKQSEAYKDSIKAGIKSISLKLDKRCNIYNRNYLESFRKTYQVGIVASEKNLLSVGSLEECARVCFMVNMNYLHNQQQQQQQPNEMPSASSSQINSQTDTTTTTITTKKFCTEFKFEPDNSYCLIDYTPAQIEENNVKLVVDAYKLDFKSLFTREYGFRFKSGSEMAQDKQQQQQGTAVDYNWDPINFQRSYKPHSISPEGCAEVCFFASVNQDQRLACRSFDFIIRFDQKLKRNFYDCQLNNISWPLIRPYIHDNDYNRYLVYENELTEDKDSDVRSLWHYELHLQLKTSDLDENFSGRLSPKAEASTAPKTETRSVYYTMLMLFVCISVGLVIGLYSARYYLQYSKSDSTISYVMERNITSDQSQANRKGNNPVYSQEEPCCSASLATHTSATRDLNHIEVPHLDMISMEATNSPKDQQYDREL